MNQEQTALASAAAGAGWVRAAEVGEAAYAARLQAQARRFSLIRSELQQGTNAILRLVTWVMVLQVWPWLSTGPGASSSPPDPAGALS